MGTLLRVTGDVALYKRKSDTRVNYQLSSMAEKVYAQSTCCFVVACFAVWDAECGRGKEERG
jgi:hypothetical protein